MAARALAGLESRAELHFARSARRPRMLQPAGNLPNLNELVGGGGPKNSARVTTAGLGTEGPWSGHQRVSSPSDGRDTAGTSPLAMEQSFDPGLPLGGGELDTTVAYGAPGGGESMMAQAGQEMLFCLSMCAGGILERHPKLKVVFLESSFAGWATFWNWWMDDKWRQTQVVREQPRTPEIDGPPSTSRGYLPHRRPGPDHHSHVHRQAAAKAGSPMAHTIVGSTISATRPKAGCWEPRALTCGAPRWRLRRQGGRSRSWG